MRDVQSVPETVPPSPETASVPFPKILILCIVTVLGNAIVSYFVSDVAKLPLYLDTMFVIALCFYSGPLPSLLTTVLLYPVFSLLSGMYLLDIPLPIALTRIAFTPCIIVEIFAVNFIRGRIKNSQAVFIEKPSLQSFMGIAPLLLTLVVIDCIAISITGGIIDFALFQYNAPRIHFPEDSFKLGLLRNNVPVLTTAILSRIPINMVDRLIVVFGGFGISLLYRKF